MATCALVGKEIGAMKVQRAKVVQRFVFAMSMLVDVVEALVLILLKDKLVLVFTSVPALVQLGDHVILWLIAVIFLDFTQCVLYGTIMALAQQNHATLVNIITYYVLAVPLGYAFAFKVFLSGSSPKEGTAIGVHHTLESLAGLRGLWAGVIVGMLNQVVLYILIIYCAADWGKIAKEQAADR